MMRANATVSLIFFVLVWTQTEAQRQHNPLYPMYGWIGEWKMTEIDRKIIPGDEYSRMPRYWRIKYELLEDSTSVLSTTYFSIGGSDLRVIRPEIVVLYFPDMYESYGFSRYNSNIEVTYSSEYYSELFGSLDTSDKIEVTYPVAKAKEFHTFKDTAGVIQYVNEIEWYSADSATVKKRYYSSGKPQNKETRYALSRVKKENQLPLPKTTKEIGEHLDKTLKMSDHDPFDYVDQFLSLEDFNCLANMHTPALDTFITKKRIPKTALRRMTLLDHHYMSVDNYYIFWRSTTYLNHTVTPIGDGFLNGKSLFYQVDYRFKYSNKEYGIKALYFYLRGEYHLVCIKRKVYK